MGKESVVRVRLDTELQEEFTQTCEAYGMQKSKVLRALIRDFCDDPQKFVNERKKKEELKVMSKIIMFLMAFMLMLPATSHANIYRVEADGDYIMGYGESRELAEQKAIEDAKRYAVEKVGTYVESYSATKNLQLTEDEVRTVAAAILRMESDPVVTFSTNADDWRCHAHIFVLVDDSNIDLEKILASRTKVEYVEKIVTVPEIHEVYVEKHSYPTDEDGLPMKPAQQRGIYAREQSLFDYAKCLTKEEQDGIKTLIGRWKTYHTGKLTILTVDDIHGYSSFYAFAELTARKWQSTNPWPKLSVFVMFDTSSGQMYVDSGEETPYLDPRQLDDIRTYILTPYAQKNDIGRGIYYSTIETVKYASEPWSEYTLQYVPKL